MIDNMFIPSD